MAMPISSQAPDAEEAGFYPKIKLLIGGEWRSRQGSPIINPANEAVIGHVPHATRVDLADAVIAAERGFVVWRAMSPLRRHNIMIEAVRLLRERTESIATTMTLEQGKPIAQSRLEVQRAADMIAWDASEGRRLYGRVIPADGGMKLTVVREPIGIVAGFSPWNFPLSAPARKVGGALAAGCAIILKASEETPGSAMLLAKAFQDASLPPGVLNLVFGDPAAISDFLITHPAVRAVTFTGSVPVGKHLAALAGKHMKPAIMELGGHGPVIVCEDTDPEAVAVFCAAAKARNAGQICIAPTRFFVHDAVYDRFVAVFTERARQFNMGDGLDPASDIGPLINQRRLDAIDELVRDAKQQGARLTAGGARAGRQGYFYPLTVLADVPDHARAMAEEPFGPLALIVRVQSVDEAIRRSNELPFALAAYAFTDSARYVALISDTIECGNLAINHLTASFAETPFGGVKESGYGREGGIEGLLCYTTAKLVSHKTHL